MNLNTISLMALVVVVGKANKIAPKVVEIISPIKRHKG
jgi:hypothetical protein